MDLIHMCNELLVMPKEDIIVPGYNTDEINSARRAFLTSWRNTIQKKIENTNNSTELFAVIARLKLKLEKHLVLALHRRYLWLNPESRFQYEEFIRFMSPYKETELNTLGVYVKSGDYNKALILMEEIFLSYLTDHAITWPIKMRSFIDIVDEFYEMDDWSKNFESMKSTGALELRLNYLKAEIEKRLVEEKNPLELRAFFTNDKAYYIRMTVDWGIKIAQRYFQLNPTDREIYEIYVTFLGFWAWPDKELELLNYIAENNYEKANELVQSHHCTF